MTALTKWTKLQEAVDGRYDDDDDDDINNVLIEGGERDNTAAHCNNNNCNPHNPLSTSTSKLLLKHSIDAMPMIVSLLSISPYDTSVVEQAVWILGSLASSGLCGVSLPKTSSTSTAKNTNNSINNSNNSTATNSTNTNNLPPPVSSSVARAAAVEITKAISNNKETTRVLATTDNNVGGRTVSSSSSLNVKSSSVSSTSVSFVSSGNPTGGGGSSSSTSGGGGNTTTTIAIDGGGLLDDHNNNTSSSSSRKDNNNNNVSARDAIFATGAMEPLLQCLSDNPNNISLQRVGAWCLSSLVEGRYSSSSSSSSSSSASLKDNNNNNESKESLLKKQPVPSEELNICTFIPTMRRMLHMSDPEVLTYTCWTLSHLCDGPAYHIAAVIYSEKSISQSKSQMSAVNGLVPRLVQLLLHDTPKVAKPALRTVGNIVCADCADTHDQFGNTLPVVDFTEVVIECMAVPFLRRLIGHHHREIQKEACWTLSNIAAGTISQIQAVIDCGAIPPLVELVSKKLTDKEVRSEACWVVLNATSCGNDQQISILVEEGCVDVLGVLLKEPNMVMMALEGIERVLQCEEAKDSEELYHKSEEEMGGTRPIIIKCATLIKSVIESTGNTTAVMKRAKRIWEQHLVSCALCHNHYSRCRLTDTHFCNECKCHVCSSCDCRVYHLSYQEELWAEDEEKKAESSKNKKNKKQKKKQKQKAKKLAEAEKEKKEREEREERERVAEAERARVRKEAEEKARKEAEEKERVRKQKEDEEDAKIKTKNAAESSKKKSQGKKKKKGWAAACDSTSLGGGATDLNRGDEGSTTSSAKPQIDLVSYLQQTGSIIALAKLLDSLYENEQFDDDDVTREERNDQAGQPTLTTQ